MERTRSVKLREKVLADGRKSLYLDYYPAVYIPETGKETRREFLKIYLHDKPANPAQKEYNRIRLPIGGISPRHVCRFPIV